MRPNNYDDSGAADAAKDAEIERLRKYDRESDLRTLGGFLSAAIPELRRVDMGRIADAVDQYIKVTTVEEKPALCPHNKDWDECPDCRH